MTRSEANMLAAELRGLMPKMTDEQMKAVRNELQKLENPDVVRERLVQYAVTHGDFCLNAAFAAARGHVDHAERTRQEADAARRRAVEIEHAWEEIDALIEPLSDEELRALKAKALERLPPLIARRRADKDPRTDRLLKGMIAELLTNPLKGHL